MGLSETILAAMIGATATIGTALFQLLTAFKARGKADTKPKRGSATRSVLAVLALMAASAAGGFLYSQLLREREGEDIRAMRQEVRELRDLTASRAMERGPDSMQLDTTQPTAVQAVANDPSAAIPVSVAAASGVAESIAYVPACHASAATDESAECHETDAQRIALCGTVPASARVAEIHLFAQPDAAQQPWEQHSAAMDADLGGARFTGKTFEYAQGQNSKAVCVNFLHWSSQHPHIARIVIQYDNGDSSPDSDQPTAIVQSPTVVPTTIAAEGIQASPQAVSFTTSVTSAAR